MDDELLVALTRCEARIKEAVRRGMNATRDIGRQLIKIETDGLYRARECERFSEYVRKFTRWDPTAAKRIQSLAVVGEQLEKAGIDVPDNEAILLELARLAPELQAPIYAEVLENCESDEIKMPVTHEAVKEAVNVIERRQAALPAEPEKTERRGLEVNLEDGAEESKAEPGAPSRPVFSERGEEALERIGRLCGEQVSTAIVKGAVMLKEDALLKWAAQEDYLVKNLDYYVTNQRWPVTKAINFEKHLVDSSTTLEQLALLARARGGNYIVQHQEFRIHIQRVGSAE